jgi:hypothetical protein
MISIDAVRQFNKDTGQKEASAPAGGTRAK